MLAIEYTDVTDAENFRAMCANHDLAGISLILKNRVLDARRPVCDGSSFRDLNTHSRFEGAHS